MSPFGSVAARLALALLGVVAGVLGIVYLIIVPLYSHELQATELRTLAGELRSAVPSYPNEPGSQFVDQWAATMSEKHDVRVIVFSYTAVPPTVTPYADSNLTTDDSGLVDDSVALAAMQHGAVARGVAEHGGKTLAEVAYPLSSTVTAEFAATLAPQLESVSVVRRRVLLAGGLSMAFAALLGYAGATLFTRRIRRLEAAAERIAAGNFDEPVADSGADELGQLARTFERMRLRLATLDRARGEFIANASHELRTPLFSLGGFLELLDDVELDDATRREFLVQMREQVDRLTKLATDLLDLSRLDAGRLVPAVEPIDLADLASELAGEFGPRAAATGHTLDLSATDDVPARGDAERTLQIGRVLVENAIVHTPAGTTVRVVAGREGGRATLAVANDGPAIPERSREQIFHRFYRLDGTRASGSGLGLAIARELAEVMGGRIELDGRGGWTTFRLVLSADTDADERLRAPVSTGNRTA